MPTQDAYMILVTKPTDAIYGREVHQYLYIMHIDGSDRSILKDLLQKTLTNSSCIKHPY